GYGDCIDCKQCVHVCPTGIDIRNGTQLECINCTACIDACDEMMLTVGFEPGLIRYASEEDIEKNEKFKFTPRLIAYTTILVVLLGVLTTMLFLRNDVEATILRLPGQTFQSTETSIKNVYTFKLINKTTKQIDNVALKLVSHKGKVTMVGGNITVPRQGLAEGTIFVDINRSDLNASKVELKFGVYTNDELIETTTSNFTGPIKVE
ncbi:MAG TPA: 4Fe-4S dicluster domain-containing protein, partial [Flavobacteriaceae bacterium]|nr:4Fe-4S dicluster domain-containing protein [Flavobacteriaceae bacterium]